MDILLSGLNGFMGKEVVKLSGGDARIAAGVDVKPEGALITCFPSFDLAEGNYDAVLDFSHHSATAALTAYAVKNGTPLVIATTGQTDEEKAMIQKASESIPVFYAANYSLGVALLIDLAKKAAKFLPGAEIEIIEKHHDRKADAPSGTALAVAGGIQEVRPELTVNCGRSGLMKREKNEIGISSVRLGNIVGEHEVILNTGNEQISLKHEAFSRSIFAEGALRACQFIKGKKPGLYGMKDLVGE